MQIVFVVYDPPEKGMPFLAVRIDGVKTKSKKVHAVAAKTREDAEKIKEEMYRDLWDPDWRHRDRLHLAYGSRGLTSDEEIRRVAERFRDALECCPRDRLPISCENFPRGACGDVTLLLSKYLEENGYSDFIYMLGTRASESHAWLQRDDLIVDITADQFDDQDQRIIVSRNSSWHATFRQALEDQHHSNFESYDANTAVAMAEAYRAVKKCLR